MKLLKTMVFTLGCIGALSANAVDGYKELKFGSTPEEIQKSHYCGSSWEKSNELKPYSDILVCKNFKFGTDKIVAAGYFLQDKLIRLGLTMPPIRAQQIYDGLLSKYGQPSSVPKEIIEKPNNTIDILFDNNTIIYRIIINKKNERSLMLIYTQADADEQVKTLQEQQSKNNIEDAL